VGAGAISSTDGYARLAATTALSRRHTSAHGLSLSSGELVQVVRERGRGEDVAVAVQALGECRPDVPKLLVWDNAPPHHTRRARQAADDAGIELAWLPFRSPELKLNPCADVWRRLKAVVAANRAYPSVDELAPAPSPGSTD
jgi:transposase